MRSRALFSFLLLSLVASPSTVSLVASDPPASVEALAPIKRFLQVGPNLYRGAQPDDEGFEFLRDMGIRTVISFRGDDSERRRVESLGMTFVHIPMTLVPFRARISDDDVSRFFTIVDDPSSGPVFFHCRRGADRTGAFTALYRIARQGWEIERAYKEAREIGLRWWYSSVKGQLKALAPTLPPLLPVPAVAQ